MAGHIIAAGDSSGCVYLLYSKAFESFTRFAHHQMSTDTKGYHPDEVWTNTHQGVQLSKQFPFRDTVVSLVHQTQKNADKSKVNQQPLEIED